MNQTHSDNARQFKKSIASSFMLVEGDKIQEKTAGNSYIVTKKMDGVMQFIFFQEGEIEAYNSGGKEMAHFPCMIEMKDSLMAAGIKNAILAAELYATIRETGRERVGDVSAAISNETLRHRLKLAVFDLMELDGVTLRTLEYSERISTIDKLFKKRNLVHPVEYRYANSKTEVCEIFNDWVVDGGAEGLVVHSDLSFVYKIKPRHGIDAVVIGYTVGEGCDNEKVRSLLFGLMRPDGSIQQIGSGSSGLSDEQRISLYGYLKRHNVFSEYITTDSRNITYQMVEPRMVFEISAIDFSTESVSGEPKMNMLLSFNENEGFTSLGLTPGVGLHGITVGKIRKDKSFNETDIRISQITDLCEFATNKRIDLSELPASDLLHRRVFAKTTPGGTAVQKFMIWKTNKEASGRFPAYVFHHTDYSAGRKEPLVRDLRVSNDYEQILFLADQFMAAKIKKGWTEII